MNWYNVFYWLTVADTVRQVCNVVAIVSFIALVITIVGYFISTTAVSENANYENLKKEWLPWKLLWKRLLIMAFILCFVSTTLNIFIPTRKDMLLIIAGGAVGNFITTDSSSKAIPADITRYLHLGLQEKISELSDEAKIEIGLKKPTLVDKIKDMSKEEIVEYLSKDTTITK